MNGNGFIIEFTSPPSCNPYAYLIRRYKGIVTKMSVIRSGGVMMAATSMIMRNECTSKVYNKYYRGALLYYFCVFVILKFAELYSPSTRSSLL